MDCKFSRCYCLDVCEILITIIDKSVLTVKRGMEHRDTHYQSFLWTYSRIWSLETVTWRIRRKCRVMRRCSHLFLRLYVKCLINLSLYGEKDFVGIIWNKNKPGACNCTWTEFYYPPAHLVRTVSLYSPVLGFVVCFENRNHILPSSFKISEWHSLTDHFRNLNAARIPVSLYNLFNWLSVLFYWCVWISLQTTVGHWITFMLQ
jgi:hypothetical protein